MSKLGISRSVGSLELSSAGTSITQDYIVRLVEMLRAEKRPAVSHVMSILSQARKLFEKQPNILRITVPDGQRITVVGDTHGQFYDLLHIFEVNGYPSLKNPYIINGDFVDRGSFGVEICLVLFCFAIAFPNSVYIIRGNHESATCTSEYGFRDEVLDKYNNIIYQSFLNVFDSLPLCAIVNRVAFIVHGGLFQRRDVTLADISKINRFCEPGEEGGELLMAQLLWSDPCDTKGYKPTARPFGCRFGPDITAHFLEENGLSFIIRSHEVRQQGYSYEHGGKLYTVFSAPNYCDDTNKGGYLHLRGKNCEIKYNQFVGTPAPRGKSYFNPDDLLPY